VIDICKGKVVTAVIQPDVSYDRTVAKCYLPDGTESPCAIARSASTSEHASILSQKRLLWSDVAPDPGSIRPAICQAAHHILISLRSRVLAGETQRLVQVQAAVRRFQLQAPDARAEGFPEALCDAECR
jgi:hypothetical protein